jgi:hypothetical protein
MRYRADVPHIVTAVAPYMEELMNLREEVFELRMKQAPPRRDLDKILEGTPITIERAGSEWNARIRFTNFNSGVYGAKTYEDALTEALRHIEQLWHSREKELRGEEDEE